MERLTLGGFLVRVAAAARPIALSYNPSPHSYARWVAAAFPNVEPLRAIAGCVPLGGWAVFAHAPWRSLGTFGVLLVTALGAAVVWLRVSWGLTCLNNRGAIGGLAVAILAVLLAVAVLWSRAECGVTSQVVVDERERR